MESSAVRVRQEFSSEGDSSIQKSDRFVSKVNPKYYKQAYRTEWESMPDFKGWLKGVPGEPTRAYCSFCKKSLHAHRLSLLKHTCTLKHTRAAQKNFALKDGTEVDGKVAMEGLGTSEEILTQPRVTEVEIVENVIIAEAKVPEDGSARDITGELPQTAEEFGEAPVTLKKRMDVALCRTVSQTQSQSQTAASCSHLFTARGLFHPEDGGDTFLRNIGLPKFYTAPHPRRRHSS